MPKGYFIFVANDVPLSPGLTVGADEIASTLLRRDFWAFTEHVPLRAKLRELDEVLIYLAGASRRYFVASAQVAKASDAITGDERAVLEGLGLSFMRHRVLLRKVRRFEPYVEIKPLIAELCFIKDKKNYGLHLRLPIVRINQEDFERIVRKTTPVDWT